MALYKQSINNNASVRESHGIFLENPNIVPEIHIATQTAIDLTLSNSDCCIVDSGASHLILQDKAYFEEVTPHKGKVTTIMGQHQLEEGYGPAILILPRGTTIQLSSAIYAPNATQNLLSFKDIRENGFHIQTSSKDLEEHLHIISKTPHGTQIRETLKALLLGLYITRIRNPRVETLAATTTKTWHQRLGHPGTNRFYQILKNAQGIPDSVLPHTMKTPRLPCLQGKFSLRPSPATT